MNNTRLKDLPSVDKVLLYIKDNISIHDRYMKYLINYELSLLRADIKKGVTSLIIGFIFCQTIDEYIYYKIVIMKWYLNLRRILSMIVVSNLIYCYIKIF